MLKTMSIAMLAVLGAVTTVSETAFAQCNLSCAQLNVSREPECAGKNLGNSCSKSGQTGSCQYRGCAATCPGGQNCICGTTLTCKVPCGDGQITGAEQCDPGRSPSGCGAGATCSSSCACAPNCGNGRIDSGELCDRGVGCAAGLFCNGSCNACVGCNPGEGHCVGASWQYGDYEVCSAQGTWQSYGACCDPGYIDCMSTPYPGPYCGWVGYGPWYTWDYYSACF